MFNSHVLSILLAFIQSKDQTLHFVLQTKGFFGWIPQKHTTDLQKAQDPKSLLLPLPWSPSKRKGPDPSLPIPIVPPTGARKGGTDRSVLCKKTGTIPKGRSRSRSSRPKGPGRWEGRRRGSRWDPGPDVPIRIGPVGIGREGQVYADSTESAVKSKNRKKLVGGSLIS